MIELKKQLELLNNKDDISALNEDDNTNGAF